MKKKRFRKIKFCLFVVVVVGIYLYTLSLLEKIDLDIDNTYFFETLIYSSSSRYNVSFTELKKLISFEPNKLLTNNFVYLDSTDTKDLVIADEIDDSPLVYIYNTHQTETYSSEYLAEYSILPSVMISSYMLKEDLEKYGINCYVEEESFSDVLSSNNWKYSKSYQISREFIEKRKKEITSIKYYIDLHRDSASYDKTTIEIDGLSYAKIMMIVGLDHDNYEDNLEEAEKINAIINELYPNLSRGIYKKSGTGVNGIYNQDFSKYVFLFEIGGVDNNIVEVNNSIKALAEVLVAYINNEEGYN